MSGVITLSKPALKLLRRRLNRARVEVTDENPPSYCELAEAGLMIPPYDDGRRRKCLPADRVRAWGW